MKFWMLSHTDALPGELGFDRSLQTARALQKLGHEVVWWNAGFSHAEKKTRTDKVCAIEYGPRLKVILLPVRAYQSNQSPSRLLSIFDFAWQFTRHHGHEGRPDAILICGPILFIEPTLLHLRWNRGLPLVFEFRDLWPEAIIHSAAGLNRLLRRVLFASSLWMRAALLRACDGIIGLNHTYLSIALEEAGAGGSRPLTGVAYPSPKIEPVDATAAPGYPAKPLGQIWALSSGTLGASHDHDTLLGVARAMLHTNPHVRIIVTGGGPHAAEFAGRIRAEGLDNVKYLGALPSGQFQGILNCSDIGLALYRQFSPVVLPTKIVDYLLAGLAIVTSAQGEAADMLTGAGAGRVVPAENIPETAAALAALSSSPSHLESVRKAATQLAFQFNHEKQMQVITDMLVAAASRSRATPLII